MKVAATFRSLPSVGFPVGTTVAVNVGVAEIASGDFAKSREANLWFLGDVRFSEERLVKV